jgi:hypothetical protein
MKTIVSTNFFHPEMYAVMESGAASGPTTIANAPAKLYLEGVTNGQLVLDAGIATTIQYGVGSSDINGSSEFNYRNSGAKSFWSYGKCFGTLITPSSSLSGVVGFELHTAHYGSGFYLAGFAHAFFINSNKYTIHWASGLLLYKGATNVTPPVGGNSTGELLNNKAGINNTWKTVRTCVWFTVSGSDNIVHVKILGIQGAGTTAVLYYTENLGSSAFTVGNISNVNNFGSIIGCNGFSNDALPVSNLSYYLLDDTDVRAPDTTVDLLPFARVMTVSKSQLDIVQDASGWVADPTNADPDGGVEHNLTDGSSSTLVKNSSDISRLRLQSTPTVKVMASGSGSDVPASNTVPHWYYMSEGSRKVYPLSAVNVRAVIPVIHKVSDDNGEDIDIHTQGLTSLDEQSTSTTFAPGVDATKGHLFENDGWIDGNDAVETSINKQNP